MRRFCLAILAVVALAAAPAWAQTQWAIDAAHSAAHFQVKHLMISNVRGEFSKISGKAVFDGRDFATLRAEAVIEAASVNTREPKRDEHLRSADFFDAGKHPAITFKSKQVRDVRGNKFKLAGDLTLRGVTKPVVLDVEASPVVQGMRNETRIGAQATTTLNRQDFGVQWNRSLDAGGVVVGNEVRIVIDLELIRQ